MIVPHFAVGQWVVMRNKRYEIFRYNSDKVVLIPVDESGPVEVVQPYYLRRK